MSEEFLHRPDVRPRLTESNGLVQSGEYGSNLCRTQNDRHMPRPLCRLNSLDARQRALEHSIV